MTPGELLKETLIKHNLKNSDLAKESGVTRVTIGRMVKDEQDINFKVFRVLRIKYGVNINKFFET